MLVRDAGVDDADAVSAVTGTPTAAARELLRARTVRVAEDDGDVTGVVAFDAGPGVVQVTRLAGSAAAMERLLQEPLDFAARETMVVELVVPRGDSAGDIAAGAGFEDVGAGPLFAGEETRRFRLEPGG